MGKEFEKNHFFPQYNLKYWKKIGSKLYDKTKKEDRDFNPANNFYLDKLYFFDDTPKLEKRLSKIESHMADLLKTISVSTNKNSIELSQYQINFIQLFLFLQAYRQLFTTEVIKDDQSGFYKSNNYSFGVFNIKTAAEMKLLMNSLVDALENFIKKKSSESLKKWMQIVFNTHLVITKNNDNFFCQSDSCCIIANDLNGNHFYTYFPQTPNLAFFLVNTKYFMREEDFLNYLAENYNLRIESTQSNLMKNLVCQYQKESFAEQGEQEFLFPKPINFIRMKYQKNWLSLIELTKNEIDYFNKILLDDGEKFIHHQKLDYIEYLQSLPDHNRTIYFHNMILDNSLPLNVQYTFPYYWEKNDIRFVQNVTINPFDVIFERLFFTKKGTDEQKSVKKELKDWLDNLEVKNNLTEESQSLHKKEVEKLKTFIDNFDQLKDKNRSDINRNLSTLNISSSELDQSQKNQSEKNKLAEKESHLAVLTWLTEYKNKNNLNLAKAYDLEKHIQTNPDAIFDFEEPQPGTSGLTREDLQRIQRRQSERAKESEESECSLE